MSLSEILSQRQWLKHQRTQDETNSWQTAGGAIKIIKELVHQSLQEKICFFVFVCFSSTHHSWCWSFSKDETKDTATDGSFNKDRGKESTRKEKKLKGLVVVFGAGWYLAGPSLWNWLSVPQWLGPCPSRLIYTQLFLFPVGLFARLLATAACFPKVLLPVLFVSWQAECNCLIVFIT